MMLFQTRRLILSLGDDFFTAPEFIGDQYADLFSLNNGGYLSVLVQLSRSATAVGSCHPSSAQWREDVKYLG